MEKGWNCGGTWEGMRLKYNEEEPGGVPNPGMGHEWGGRGPAPALSSTQDQAVPPRPHLSTHGLLAWSRRTVSTGSPTLASSGTWAWYPSCMKWGRCSLTSVMLTTSVVTSLREEMPILLHSIDRKYLGAVS